MMKSRNIIVKYVKTSAVNYCSSQYSVFLTGNYSLQIYSGEKSSLWSQTYSGNKDGLNLVHFREYGPLWSKVKYYTTVYYTVYCTYLPKAVDYVKHFIYFFIKILFWFDRPHLFFRTDPTSNTCTDTNGYPINEGLVIPTDDPCVSCECRGGVCVESHAFCAGPRHERCLPVPQAPGSCCTVYDCSIGTCLNLIISHIQISPPGLHRSHSCNVVM